MINDSQLIIKIIQYISITGLFLSSILALIIVDKKKKFIFLFLMFISAGMLSYILYSGFVIFTVGFVFVFFFILLYITIIQWESIGSNNQEKRKSANKPDLQNGRKSIKKILNIALPLLLCGAIGYLIFNSANRYLAEVGNQQGDQAINVSFSDPGLVIKSILSSYGLAVIILASALFITFLWFIIIIKLSHRQKNGEK